VHDMCVSKVSKVSGVSTVMKICFEEASRVLKHLNNTFCDEQTNTTQMHRFSGEFRQTLLDFFSIRIFSASG